MATASPNNHSTTRELNLMLSQDFKPTYRPHDNKGQHSKDNSKYQKQTAHTSTIEDYAAQHKAMYLNMCENFTAKIPANKPIPLFSFG